MKINKLIGKKFIHYGEFNIEDNSSLINLINIISKPSNILNKITIVDGWSQKELNLELSKYFRDYRSIPYEDIIADTKDGLYVKNWYGGMTEHEMFTFSSAETYKIENGEVKETYRPVKLSGNLFTTLKNINGIADDIKINKLC